MNKFFMMGLLLWYVSACNGATRSSTTASPRDVTVVTESTERKVEASGEGTSSSSTVLTTPVHRSLARTVSMCVATTEDVIGGASSSRSSGAGSGGSTSKAKSREGTSTATSVQHRRTFTAMGSRAFTPKINSVLRDINEARISNPVDFLLIITQCHNSKHRAFFEIQKAWLNLPANLVMFRTIELDTKQRIVDLDEEFWILGPTHGDAGEKFCMCYMLFEASQRCKWINGLQKLPQFEAVKKNGAQGDFSSDTSGQWMVPTATAQTIKAENAEVTEGVGSSSTGVTMYPLAQPVQPTKVLSQERGSVEKYVTRSSPPVDNIPGALPYARPATVTLISTPVLISSSTVYPGAQSPRGGIPISFAVVNNAPSSVPAPASPIAKSPVIVTSPTFSPISSGAPSSVAEAPGIVESRSGSGSEGSAPSGDGDVHERSQTRKPGESGQNTNSQPHTTKCVIL